MTILKEKKYLKDNVVTKLFSDKSCQEYLFKIISAALKMDYENISKDFEFVDIRIGANLQIKNSEADIVGKTDYCYFNIEINYNSSEISYNKNVTYLCQLILRQLDPKDTNSYKNILPIYQININNYDYFKENKFIYTSSIMEENLHLSRSKLVKIIDINVDFLSDIDYTKIMEESDDSLEKLLYIFVCDNKNILDKVYAQNIIMKKVREKLGKLETNIDAYLYYDKKELQRIAAYDEAKALGHEEGLAQGLAQGLAKGLAQGHEAGHAEGHAEGLQEGIKTIALEMLSNNEPLEKICKYTKLSKEDLKKLINLENEHI